MSVIQITNSKCNYLFIIKTVSVLIVYSKIQVVFFAKKKL